MDVIGERVQDREQIKDHGQRRRNAQWEMQGEGSQNQSWNAGHDCQGDNVLDFVLTSAKTIIGQPSIKSV